MASDSTNAINNSTSEATLLDERRRRMLERLSTRRIARSGAGHAAPSNIEDRGNELSSFDELRTRVNELMKSTDARIEHSVLKELEDALAILPPGLQLRRLREAYNDLRARLQQQSSANQKKTAFSFSSKPLSKSKSVVDAPSSLNQRANDGGQLDDIHHKFTTSIAVPDDSITAADKEGEFVKLVGKGGEDVLISSLRNCHVSVPFSASAVHLKDVHDSTLVLAPVSSSILVRNCSGLILVAAAQQIRAHKCHNLKLHIAVRGAVVMEDCDGFQMAPYRVRGVTVDWDNDNWRKVQDFDWLSAEQNPHWCVIDKSLWETFDIDMCEACTS